MKKNVLYILLAVATLASCRKDEHVFNESPDARVNAALKAAQAALTASKTGWNANLATGDGATYRFYFLFNDSNRVWMYSDFDSTTSTVIKQSSYRLKALQQPSLIFDTYNYIHILSDPDAGVNGGVYGNGLNSDFEFMIDTVATDSITLTGRLHGSKMTLTKATAQDRAVWDNKQVKNGIPAFKNFGNFLYYFKRLTYAGTQYELMFDTTIKKATVSWSAGGQIQSVSRGYYYWANGIGFTSPVVNGSTSIPWFSIGAWNGSTQTLSVTVNGTAATVTGFNAPLNPDVNNAPMRWWNQGASAGTYWVSYDGFHINGVNDAYNINSLKTDTSEYYYLIYWPAAGSNYDAMAPIYLNKGKNALELYYGSAFSMNTQSGGKTRFNEVGTIGDTTYPASGPAVDTRTQFKSTSGFYFVQSSAYTYDMVSAADARIWLTWYWLL